jgi:hypothetical protein
MWRSCQGSSLFVEDRIKRVSALDASHDIVKFKSVPFPTNRCDRFA